MRIVCAEMFQRLPGLMRESFAEKCLIFRVFWLANNRVVFATRQAVQARIGAHSVVRTSRDTSGHPTTVRGVSQPRESGSVLLNMRLVKFWARCFFFSMFFFIFINIKQENYAWWRTTKHLV